MVRRLPPAARAIRLVALPIGAGVRFAAAHAPSSLRLRRLLVVLVFAVVALAGLFLWARDSSLVRVEKVTIVGVNGPDAARVRSALTDAAQTMTTLHVRKGALDAAVRPFPTVRGLTVSAHLPHELRIVVAGRPPVAAVALDGRHVPVAADGTLLPETNAPSDMPLLDVRGAAAGTRLSDRRAADVLATVTAAPAAMRVHVARVLLGPEGLQADLRDGPVVYLGSAERLHAKWIAADRVLSDSGSRGAKYVDVRLPERAVAGGLPEQQPSTTG